MTPYATLTVTPKHYRCSKGHEWTRADFRPATTVSFNNDPRQWCLQCILEFMEQHCGVVSPDRPAGADLRQGLA